MSIALSLRLHDDCLVKFGALTSDSFPKLIFCEKSFTIHILTLHSFKPVIALLLHGVGIHFLGHIHFGGRLLHVFEL